MLILGQSHRVLQHTRVRQWGAVGRKSYRTVRSGAPANFRILHGKISHETNKQWKSSYKKPRCSLDLRVVQAKEAAEFSPGE